MHVHVHIFPLHICICALHVHIRALHVANVAHARVHMHS